MKTFKLHGNTAYWNKLGLVSLNLNTLQQDETTPIPDEKRVHVSVVSNLYKVVDDGIHETLKGEISESDKTELLSTLKNETPDFILSLGDKVVGYANYRLRNGATEPETSTPSYKSNFDIRSFIDDSLTMNPAFSYIFLSEPIVPVDWTEEKDEEKEDDIAALKELRKKLSCENGIERIAIIDHAMHTLYIEDIPLKVLEEEYNGEEEDYIKDNYTFDGEWEWDYITDVEYTPDGGETYSIEPSDFVD